MSPSRLSAAFSDLRERSGFVQRKFNKALRILRAEGFPALMLAAARRFSLIPRELSCRMVQPKLLTKNYSPKSKRLIVFLTPGYDDGVSGGVMSISSLYAETMKLTHIHGADVILCTPPGDPRLLRYTKFNNNNYIYTFSQALSYFGNTESILIHIPECYVDQFLGECSRTDYSRLKTIRDIHLNIMILGIALLGSQKSIRELGKLGKLTCSTGGLVAGLHRPDSIIELGRRLGCPIYKFGKGFPTIYPRRSYAEKENLMIVSKDWHPKKEEILRKIASDCRNIRIVIAENMTHEQFMEVTGRAKWTVTFGEGLDSHFLEAVFSGGIGFIVYNVDYFTEDFQHLRTVYAGYDMMSRNICSDIESLDNQESYASYQTQQYELCRKHFDYQEYVRNLASFYQCEFAREAI